jgi:hypothetical protein
MEELKVIWVVRRPGGEPPSLLFFEYLSLHCHVELSKWNSIFHERDQGECCPCSNL